jgi:hypothetical protein
VLCGGNTRSFTDSSAAWLLSKFCADCAARVTLQVPPRVGCQVAFFFQAFRKLWSLLAC